MYSYSICTLHIQYCMYMVCVVLGLKYLCSLREHFLISQLAMRSEETKYEIFSYLCRLLREVLKKKKKKKCGIFHNLTGGGAKIG